MEPGDVKEAEGYFVMCCAKRDPEGKGTIYFAVGTIDEFGEKISNEIGFDTEKEALDWLENQPTK